MFIRVVLMGTAFCIGVFAQGTAQIHGTIQDTSGAAVADAAVKATQTDTGVERTINTQPDGSYVLSNLPLGPYKLEVTKEGFSAASQTGITLQVGSDPAVPFTLKVGAVSETVSVEANAELVETRTTAIGQVVDNERILDLPLNGRNVTDLVLYEGGAIPGNPGGLAISNANPFNRTTTSVSIGGGLAGGVNYMLDGVSHSNPANNLELPMPFPDSLQEFKVETSALSAESGMHAAGAVQAVTRAGTNQFHGDAFEFVRNYLFNARNFFALQRDSLKRNQFGGVVGGPVKRNKVFFFAGYQGTTIRQDAASTNISFVPTAAMEMGNFTAFASAACQGTQVNLKAPFVNDTIAPSLLSPAALALAAKLPPAQNQCGRVVWGTPTSENDNQGVGRLDYQVRDNHTIFLRYVGSTIEAPEPYSLSGDLLASGAGLDVLGQSLVFGDTYVFSPTVVNSFRIAGNRIATRYIGPSCCSLPSLGVQNMYPYGGTSSYVIVTGGFTLGGNTDSNGHSVPSVISIADDLNVIRGAHQLGFGVSYDYSQYNYLSQSFSRGQINFNGQSTGLGLADFLTGDVFTYAQAPPNSMDGREKHIGLYARDTWKLTSRLTVNIGLRWEPFLPFYRVYGEVTHFDLSAYDAGIETNQFTNAPPGITFPGDPGFPGNSGISTHWMNFAPRAGIAWDPTGSGRTSIRAAYGLFYDFLPYQYFNNTSTVSPWTPKITLNNVSFDNPFANYPGGNPFPTASGKNAIFVQGGEYTTFPYDAKNTSTSQWNASIQHQLGTDWLMSATYLGNESSHLWTEQNLNPAVYIPGGPCVLAGVTYNPCSTTANTQQRRVLSLISQTNGQYFGKVDSIDAGGTASYEGLLLNVQRRFSSGVTVNANYTWSHCISDPFDVSIASAGGTGSTGGQEYLFVNDRRADRGNCLTSATDRRQVFTLTAVTITPRFSNRWAKAVASGWSVSPILQVRTGDYSTVVTSSDIALDGQPFQRPNQVLTNIYGNGTLNDYLNRAAFVLPATGTLGNEGVATVLGPGFYELDLALTRRFQVRESQHLEFRAEAFNLTNTLRKEDPSTIFGTATFGQITAAYDPRIMQFAFKYFF